jgi:hypothetical protein
MLRSSDMSVRLSWVVVHFVGVYACEVVPSTVFPLSFGLRTPPLFRPTSYFIRHRACVGIGLAPARRRSGGPPHKGVWGT